jgi:hypothetical protein
VSVAPAPVQVRETSIRELHRLRLPLPPPEFPLVWEPGDEVELRPVAEIEDRIAVLNVVLARTAGVSSEHAMKWMFEAHLVDRLTRPEWNFVVDGTGDPESFALHREALFALSWLLGIALDLDPLLPAPAAFAERLPSVADGESFTAWRQRTLAAPRDPGVAAAQLDLYYCLDWSYLHARQHKLAPPGEVDSDAIGQRRWALEWAVVFDGPYHGAAPVWDQVDLST